MKIQKIWEDEKDGFFIEETMKIIIDNIDIIVKLLYPVLLFYANKMWRGYRVEGFAACKDEKYDICYLYILLVISIVFLPFKLFRSSSFTSEIESVCKNKYIKQYIRSIKTSLPGYDWRLPKIILEQIDRAGEYKLQKYIESNIGKN